MNLIIFGATGFFGSNFVSNLRNHNVICITREVVVGNSEYKYIRYQDFEKEKFKNYFDFAIDFSSYISVESFLNNPQEAFLNNIDIPIKNVRFLSDVGFKGKYVYISTDRALVEPSNGNYANSLEIKNDPYGASKFIGELIVHYSSSLGWPPATTIRFPNLYGCGQTSKQLIPSILQRLKEGSEHIELGSIKGSRNYLHISDAVDALLKFIEAPINYQNLCISGENVKIEMIIECFSRLLKDNYGKHVKFSEKEGLSMRKNYTIPPKLLDDKIFREHYKWEPKLDINQGIKILLENENNEN